MEPLQNTTSTLAYKDNKFELESIKNQLLVEEGNLANYLNLVYVAFDNEETIEQMFRILKVEMQKTEQLRRSEVAAAATKLLNINYNFGHVHMVISDLFHGKIVFMNTTPIKPQQVFKDQNEEEILKIHKLFMQKCDQIVIFSHTHWPENFAYLMRDLKAKLLKKTNLFENRMDTPTPYKINSNNNNSSNIQITVNAPNSGVINSNSNLGSTTNWNSFQINKARINMNINIINHQKQKINFESKQFAFVCNSALGVDQSQQNYLHQEFECFNILLSQYKNLGAENLISTLEQTLSSMEATIPIQKDFVISLLCMRKKKKGQKKSKNSNKNKAKIENILEQVKEDEKGEDDDTGKSRERMRQKKKRRIGFQYEEEEDEQEESQQESEMDNEEEGREANHQETEKEQNEDIIEIQVKNQLCSYEFAGQYEMLQKKIAMKGNEYKNLILRNGIYEFLDLKVVQEDLEECVKDFWDENRFVNSIKKNFPKYKALVNEEFFIEIEKHISVLYTFQIYNIKKRLKKSFKLKVEEIVQENKRESNAKVHENIHKILKKEKNASLVNIKKNFFETFDEDKHFSAQIDMHIDETLEQIEIILNKIIVAKLRQLFIENVEQTLVSEVFPNLEPKIYELFLKGDKDFNFKVAQIYEGIVENWRSNFDQQLREFYLFSGKMNQELIEHAEYLYYKGVNSRILDLLNPEQLITKIKNEFPNLTPNYGEIKNMMKELCHLQLRQPQKLMREFIDFAQSQSQSLKEALTFQRQKTIPITGGVEEQLLQESQESEHTDSSEEDDNELLQKQEKQQQGNSQNNLFNHEQGTKEEGTDDEDEHDDDEEDEEEEKEDDENFVPQRLTLTKKDSLKTFKRSNSSLVNNNIMTQKSKSMNLVAVDVKMKELIKERIKMLSYLENSYQKNSKKLSETQIGIYVNQKIEQIKLKYPFLDLVSIKVKENLQKKQGWAVYILLLMIFWSLDQISWVSSLFIFLSLQIFMIKYL